ncbi:MAG: hypothetical protein LBF16_08170 [Pseudomonadales bacterium]|jgi:hypothetical protein|nr:hypothetical protein [Pseudomonadales bacterium]
MKQSSAANLALLLLIVGWFLAFYGLVSQMGDPAPSVSREQIQAAYRLSHAVLCRQIDAQERASINFPFIYSYL